jgi:hypothetical protein
MIGKPLAATIALSTAWAVALAGCVIPEPITEEPPAVVPDQGLLIFSPPPYSSVRAQPEGLSSTCIVNLSIPQVLDPSSAPLTARIFLNLDSSGPDQALTDAPLLFEGGTTDLQLGVANEGFPTLFSLPNQPINLSDYLPYLQPSGSSQPNFLSIFISDDFSDDQNTLWQPVAGKLYASVVLEIDLTECLDFFVP